MQAWAAAAARATRRLASTNTNSPLHTPQPPIAGSRSGPGACIPVVRRALPGPAPAPRPATKMSSYTAGRRGYPSSGIAGRELPHPDDSPRRGLGALLWVGVKGVVFITGMLTWIEVAAEWLEQVLHPEEAERMRQEELTHNAEVVRFFEVTSTDDQEFHDKDAALSLFLSRITADRSVAAQLGAAVTPVLNAPGSYMSQPEFASMGAETAAGSGGGGGSSDGELEDSLGAGGEYTRGSVTAVGAPSGSRRTWAPSFFLLGSDHCAIAKVLFEQTEDEWVPTGLRLRQLSPNGDRPTIDLTTRLPHGLRYFSRFFM